MFVENDHLEQSGLDESSFKEVMSEFGLDSTKYKLLSKPVIKYGLVRIGYDGKIFTPEDAIHTADYHKAKNILKENKTIEELYSQLYNSC